MTLAFTLDQTNMIDVYRTFHPKAIEYTFLTLEYIIFTSAHETFSRIYYILGHKTSLGTF